MTELKCPRICLEQGGNANMCCLECERNTVCDHICDKLEVVEDIRDCDESFVEMDNFFNN